MVMTLDDGLLLIFGEHPIADASVAPAGGFAIRTRHGLRSDNQSPEDDGGCFLAQPGFDDKTAELDLVAGILLAGVHGDAAEAAIKPDQEMPDALAPARLSLIEIVPR